MSAPGRILVVDDNAPLRENLAECLEGEGYEVSVAASGPAALARLAEGPLPGVVLLDLMMPGMSGRELAAEIRANPRYNAVRLILTTGYTSARERAGVVVDAVLTKPFGVKELLAALERVGH
jgi:CheY-like chemotaxis protein